MMRVICDLCGKELRPGEDNHFVVKMDVFAAGEPAALTEADLDHDHLAELSELLQEMDEMDEDPFPPAAQQLRFDLCSCCRQRFVRDPLGKEAASKQPDFSEN